MHFWGEIEKTHAYTMPSLREKDVQHREMEMVSARPSPLIKSSSLVDDMSNQLMEGGASGVPHGFEDEEMMLVSTFHSFKKCFAHDALRFD